MNARSVNKNKILKAFNKVLQNSYQPIFPRLKAVIEADVSATISRATLYTIISGLCEACPNGDGDYHDTPQFHLYHQIRYLVRKILKALNLGLGRFGDGEKTFIQAFSNLHRFNMLNPDNLWIILDHKPFSDLAKAVNCLADANARSLTQDSFTHLLTARGNCVTVAAIFNDIYSLDREFYSNVQHIIAQLENPEGLYQAICDLKSSGLFHRHSVEALLDQQLLIQMNGPVIWNTIPSDLLTQDVLDEIFNLAKRPNPIENIKAFLEPFRQYTNARSAIYAAEEKFHDIERSKWKIYGSLIGMPRYIFSELLKQAFSWVLGFEWVLRISSWLNLSHKRIEVYNVGFSSPYHPAGAGHLVAGKYQYKVTLLNFLFIPIHYLMRNFGKLLAGILLLPWTIPITLVNRTVALIRTAVNSAKVKRNIKMIAANGNQALLIRDWFSGRLGDPYDKKVSRFFRKYLLKYSDPESIQVGIEDFNFAAAFNNQRKYDSVSYRLSNQVQTLCKTINKETKRIKTLGIITTVLCAILLTPFSLAVSIPLLVKKLRRNKSLLEGVQKGEENVNSIADSLEIIASQGTEKAFELGMKYLEEQNKNDAYVFLSRVPKHDPNYLRAMNECGDILLTQGDHEAAGDFYKKAGNRGFAYITQRLEQGQHVSVTDADVILNTIPTQETPQPSVHQHTPGRSYSAGSASFYTQPFATGSSTANIANAEIKNSNHK